MPTDIFLLSKPLQLEEIEDGAFAGHMRLTRAMVVSYYGETVTIPAGEQTDLTSWPNWLPLPRPKWTRMKIAGVVHDYLYRHGTFGENGRVVGYFEANKIWRNIATAGIPSNKLNPFWGFTGWVGLNLGGFFKWRMYKNDR